MDLEELATATSMAAAVRLRFGCGAAAVRGSVWRCCKAFMMLRLQPDRVWGEGLDCVRGFSSY